MNDYNYLHPGLLKLIHHQGHLEKIANKNVVGPIHLSVFPNNACQLNCEYCCFKKTERNKNELSYKDFCCAVDVLTKYGLKALEFSGSGEPLLWSEFNHAVNYASDKGLKLSLVTNGLALTQISRNILSKFTWIRPSIQSEEYARKIDLNYIPSNVKKTMSYIVYNEDSFKEIEHIYDFAKEKNIIVRIAPIRPCNLKWEKMVEFETKRLGNPLVFFNKEFGSPSSCYMLWVRAAIDWNANFLPCPSIELTPEHAGKIPDDFGVCKISKIEEWLLNNRPFDLGYRCSFCNCGKDTNDFIHSLLQKMEDVDFV